MIKIDDNVDDGVDVDNLAVQHFENLVGKLLNNGVNYHARNSLVQRIRNRKLIDAALPDQARVDFWDYLLDNNFQNLRRVVTGRPEVLKQVLSEIELLCGPGFFSNDIDYNGAQLTDFGVIVRDIFNYRAYRDSQHCHDNCSGLGLSFCPYCNLGETQVISVINNLLGEELNKALLQLDHFYPQVRHPYFAVSFFNLIPGCSICNAVLKLEKRFDIDTHFNPYQKRLNDYFAFELSNFLIEERNDIEIIYKNKQEYPPNALIDFRIMERYKSNAVTRVAFRQFQSLKHHSPKIRRSLRSQFFDLFRADSQKLLLLENLDVPLSDQEINEVYLGKLKRDIAKQMGLILEP